MISELFTLYTWTICNTFFLFFFSRDTYNESQAPRTKLKSKPKTIPTKQEDHIPSAAKSKPKTHPCKTWRQDPKYCEGVSRRSRKPIPTKQEDYIPSAAKSKPKTQPCKTWRQEDKNPTLQNMKTRHHLCAYIYIYMCMFFMSPDHARSPCHICEYLFAKPPW